MELVDECLKSISLEIVDDEGLKIGGLRIVDAGDGPVWGRTLGVLLLGFDGVINGGTERRSGLLGTQESGKCDASGRTCLRFLRKSCKDAREGVALIDVEHGVTGGTMGRGKAS